MNRRKLESYKIKKIREQEIDLFSKSETALDERIEGMDNIRKVLNPTMSRSTFYKRHRRHLDYILMENIDWFRKREPRYFTFKRLILHYMIKKRRI